MGMPAATAIANDEVEFALVGAVDLQVDTQLSKRCMMSSACSATGQAGWFPAKPLRVLLCSPECRALEIAVSWLRGAFGLADEANPVARNCLCRARLTTAVSRRDRILPAPARVTTSMST